MNVVIPMAGLGQRFKDQGFSVTKPLIDMCGTPMIVRVIESLQIRGNYIFILRNQDELAKLKDVLLSTTKIYPNFIRSVKFLTIDYLTDGPASTVLVAKDLINTNEPLVVANCDQIMWWNGKLFQTFCELSGHDGVIVTYYSNSIKNSYAKINRSGSVLEVREKEIISKISLNGIHFWSKGRLFVESAEDMIAANNRSINGEFYVGPSYNKMIESGYKVGIYHLPNRQHHAVGTPDDLREYLRNENLQAK